MESELTSTLGQIQTRKRHVNAESDLSKECESIRELDKRLDTLLLEIQQLKGRVTGNSAYVASTCDNLRNISKTLKRSSEINELSKMLGNLNRLCIRIDKLGGFTNEIFAVSALAAERAEARVSGQLDGKLHRLVYNEDTGTLLRMVGELCSEFEANYLPLAATLERRTDLPYAGYWSRVLQTKDYMATICSANNG